MARHFGSTALVISVATSLLFGAGTALAQCAFDGPAKAKGMRSSLIRQHAGCPCITPYPCSFAPNSTTGSNVPSCAPPFARSEYEFDNKKGACSFRLKTQIEDPCPIGSPDPCSATYVDVRCSGILDDDEPGLTNDDGWVLNIVVRTTFDDATYGDMTVIDVPIELPLAPADDGTLGFGGQPQLLLDLEGQGLPACTHIEVLFVAVQDPDGNRFAVLGSGTRPKGL